MILWTPGLPALRRPSHPLPSGLRLAWVLLLAGMFSYARLHAQTSTITVNSTNTISVASSAGGACTISGKTPGNSSFAWTCTAPSGPTVSGQYTSAAGVQDFMIWNSGDLFCIVAINATANTWPVNPNTSTGQATFTIPVQSLGLMCSSKTSPAVSNTVVP